MGYTADYKTRCIALYTDTRCVTALHSYTAEQRYTALYIIQLYSAIHYTTLYNPPLRPTRSLEIMVPSTLTTGALCPTRTTMVLMLVHLQGAAVIFRVGRHHNRGPFCEGRGLTHALTDTAPTDLTVAYASPLGAQLQSNRVR